MTHIKIALCFIISYDHILNKEHIWREWIKPNKDLINVYFYYKDFAKIESEWIKEHTIPQNCIYSTSYLHVIPAYLSVLNYAMNDDKKNKWFCMLTDACCPIISPKKFRYLFYKHHKYSIFSWKAAWWNPVQQKRGNLSKLPKDLWLANDPWFVLTRENVHHILNFVESKNPITGIICDGGLANETLFAAIFKCYNELENGRRIKNEVTHITDWNRRSSSTSPHVFLEGNQEDIDFIKRELERNKYSMFIRKISPSFPDKILRDYIYDHNAENDNKLVLVEPFENVYGKMMDYGFWILAVIFLYNLARFFTIDFMDIQII